MLSVFPAFYKAMPDREAIFHALVRKNSSCPHFIDVRWDPGVGGSYGTFDAHSICH